MLDYIVSLLFSVLNTSHTNKNLALWYSMPSNEWDVPAETSKTNSHLVDEGFAQKVAIDPSCMLRQSIVPMPLPTKSTIMLVYGPAACCCS